MVEKCIKIANEEQRDSIILQISKIDKLVTVMRNSFGNYVVQTALEMAQGDTKMALADTIYSNISLIQDKKIRTKWAQLLHQEVCNDSVLSQRYDLGDFMSQGSNSPERAMAAGMIPSEGSMHPQYVQEMPQVEQMSMHQHPPSVQMQNPEVQQQMFLGFQNNGAQNNFNVFAPFGHAPNFNDEDED